jgi:hypothetical protein
MLSEIAAGDWMKVSRLHILHDIILTTAAVGDLFCLKTLWLAATKPGGLAKCIIVDWLSNGSRMFDAFAKMMSIMAYSKNKLVKYCFESSVVKWWMPSFVSSEASEENRRDMIVLEFPSLVSLLHKESLTLIDKMVWFKQQLRGQFAELLAMAYKKYCK